MIGRVIREEAFLELSAEAQILYVNLVLEADDEGFVANPKGIARFIGTSSSSLQELINSKYIISFDSGVVVIVHWHKYNKVRSDRKKQTDHIDEYEQLDILNSIYVLKSDVNQLSTNCQPTDNQVSTNGCHKLSKDKISKDKLSNTCASEDAPASTQDQSASVSSISYDELINTYNTICTDLPSCKKLTDARRKHLKSLLNLLDDMTFADYCRKVQSSDFLCGRSESHPYMFNNYKNESKPKWKASFDWIINKSNAVKVIEGNYDNRSSNSGNAYGDYQRRSSYDINELNKIDLLEDVEL